MEALCRAAGLRMPAVHFRAAAALMATLVSGAVDLTATRMSTVAGLVGSAAAPPAAPRQP